MEMYEELFIEMYEELFDAQRAIRDGETPSAEDSARFCNAFDQVIFVDGGLHKYEEWERERFGLTKIKWGEMGF